MINLSISYKILAFDDLTSKDRQLVLAAESSWKNAHAPYSHFFVGSAVRDLNGKITTGNNQENAAYPSGLCAERVALFAAKSQEKTALDTIVVLAKNQVDILADAFPCGNCRQVMMEYATMQTNPIRILMQRKEGDFIAVDDVKSLLPFHFDAQQLK
ncbi:MAG: cytidine deaminase [Cyclobacteriaceae bacterium]|jgi:cytidine deaminase